MKQFANAYDRSHPCCQYLTQKFPLLSEAKVKESVFSDPQIRQLISESTFTNSMNDLELQAWGLFKEVIIRFLGKFKDLQYQQIVKNVL
jgi:hypothetical protein